MSRRTVGLVGVSLAVALLSVLPAPAQPGAKVPDADPEIERRSFQVADGFEVNLFAADPLLAKPIQMNFDPAGRLWVACSAVYPQIKPGQKPTDKIIVLEDTKGAGRADKTTVFADGLLIPTGLEPGDGGVYVADSTDLLHLADTDGDGKADRRRVVLSGFGTEDTHHMLHTLRWGPDGLLYMNQSIYIHSHVETPHGVRRLAGGGIWQFRPESLRLEVFARGWVNPWGHHFDRWGQSFVTDGAGGEGVNYVIPGASYTTAVGASRVVPGLNPGSPKYCGHEIVSGRHLPDDWQGNLITNDFRGHRVCRFVLKEDGAGFTAQEKAELIKTTHAAFRPVDVKMGPDGAIYIADWYNPIIQHGEVDFRDPRRDLTHGRIWRVTAKGRPLVERPSLTKATVEALLDALKTPEDWTRHQARRLLKERGARKVEPALGKWVIRLDTADPEHEHHLLEALWTYQSLDVVETRLLATLLGARDHRARTAAVRVLSYWHPRVPRALELLSEAVTDDHPRVRLEAVRVLGQIPQLRAAELALQALDKPVDRFLDYALWQTARELEPVWMSAVQKGRLDLGGNPRHLVFALQAVGSPSVVKPLAELIQAGKVPRDREESVLTLIAEQGGPTELDMVLDLALAKVAAAPGRQASLLTALELAARRRGVRPAGDLNRAGKLLTSDTAVVRAAAARLAGLWQLEALRPQLIEYAGAADISESVRQAAFEGLALLGGSASREALEQLAGKDRSYSLRVQAVVALTALDLPAAAGRAVDVLTASSDGADTAEVFAALLKHKNGPAALTKALADRKLPADVAKVGVRSVRASGRDAPALVEALTKAGGLTTGPRALSAGEMEQLVADVVKHGDAARGEAVFRRKDQGCLKCHAIAGAGGLVGPDLASIGASAPVDYLIDSLLLPNKAIKENYHSLVVTTKQGRLFTGIKVRETAAELVLRDADDKEVVIPVGSIEERGPGRSLMAEGLTDTLPRVELLDLVRFLSELGKVGPFAAGNARLARRWQALEATAEAKRHLQRAGFAAAAGDDPALTWTPAYSTVAGVLPLEEVPTLDVKLPFGKEAQATAFVRCQLDATTGGKVTLRLNAADGLTAWLNGAPIEAKGEMVLDLPAGLHTLTFAVDRSRRREGLRGELDDVPGSPARVRVLGGK
jgi:putative heme-binding domain-containing protein